MILPASARSLPASPTDDVFCTVPRKKRNSPLFVLESSLAGCKGHSLFIRPWTDGERRLRARSLRSRPSGGLSSRGEDVRPVVRRGEGITRAFPCRPALKRLLTGDGEAAHYRPLRDKRPEPQGVFPIIGKETAGNTATHFSRCRGQHEGKVERERPGSGEPRRFDRAGTSWRRAA